MRGNNPPRPSGYNAESVFHQRTHDKVNGPELRLGNSSTVSVSRTSRGVFARVRPGKGGSKVNVQRFRVKSDQGTYYACKEWDGTTEGADVNVAKPLTLQNDGNGTTATETVLGVDITYTYSTMSGSITGTCQRVASATGETDQTEIVIPTLHADGTSEIYAVQNPVGGTGVDDVTWLDLNVDARAWCQIA